MVESNPDAPTLMPPVMEPRVHLTVSRVLSLKSSPKASAVGVGVGTGVGAGGGGAGAPASRARTLRVICCAAVLRREGRRVGALKSSRPQLHCIEPVAKTVAPESAV